MDAFKQYAVMVQEANDLKRRIEKLRNDPNEAYVITFFGKYIGTVKDSGFFWINPLTSKRQISLRSNNLNGEVIKVNDKVGNPVMMGCVVVWRVNDTAKACFDVQDYYNYVRVQSESAVRYVGCMYPYDKVNEDDVCLRSGHEEVHRVLQNELSERLKTAGIEVQEARITELAYSSEIANAMLKRQAAEAIIAAREKIVQGAVSIVGHALKKASPSSNSKAQPLSAKESLSPRTPKWQNTSPHGTTIRTGRTRL